MMHLLLTAALSGCSWLGSDRQDSVPVEPSEQQLAQLEALGYVSWDEEADASFTGVDRYDEAKAWRGYNLHTDDESVVYLRDMKGAVVKQWQVPGDWRSCEYARLLDDGDVMVVCFFQGVARLDWDGDVVWKRDVFAHHDIDPAPDGGFYVPIVAQKAPFENLGKDVYFDSVVRIPPGGGEPEVVWAGWPAKEAFAAHHPTHFLEGDGPPAVMDNGSTDWFHLNSLHVLPATELGATDPRFAEGNVLLSFRNLDLIAVMDPSFEEILWTWGPGELQWQHAATMLDTGRILVFDNGTRRESSRVLEVDPTTGRVTWQWQADPPADFFSAWRGNAQRLPNGNTLVDEADRGHAFEITPEGEVVWSFWNPILRKTGLTGTARKRMYRVERYPPELVESLLASGEGGAQ